MLSLDDPIWKKLKGGYQIPYDPRPALKKLQEGKDDEGVWQELWNELHHQGDVGEASYAAVPHLVRIEKARGSLGWNFFLLVCIIEIERHRERNPPVPDWLRESYEKAWDELPALAWEYLQRSRDELAIQTALAVIAISKGQLKLGALLATIDRSEIDEFAIE